MSDEKLRVALVNSRRLRGASLARWLVMMRVVCCLVAILTGCMERKACPVYAQDDGIADQLLRDPSTGQCESFGSPCDSSCGPCPGLTEALPPEPDWGSCNGACAALSETQCLACSAVDCGTGNLCVVTPAAPTTATCEPSATAGTCGNASCDIVPPNCPVGTTPGIAAAGCYTGFCIPTVECAAMACASLASESACLARSDCDAVYDGMNCTCDKNGCTCQTETYDHCQ